MSRRTVTTDKAPKAIGPYSQASIIHDIVYTSGQIGLDPVTGEMAGRDIETQTARALDNLEAVLKAAGSSFDDVVKSTIYLADLKDFGRVNALYAERFGDNPPARATIEVAALPLGALVEIDMIATLSEDSQVW